MSAREAARVDLHSVLYEVWPRPVEAGLEGGAQEHSGGNGEQDEGRGPVLAPQPQVAHRRQGDEDGDHVAAERRHVPYRLLQPVWPAGRSETRRVGQAWGSAGRSWGSPE